MTITGEFKDNMANGKCTIDYSDGSQYEGSIKNCKRHG
jgi:hypothetical protein